MKIDKKTEKELKKVASEIVNEVKKESVKDVKDLAKKVEELTKSLSKKSRSLVKKVLVEQDVEKGVDELDTKEKVKAFSMALATANVEAIKALSEGVAADGGNLVPQDFYRTLVRERDELTPVTNKVNVVPMKTNVLTIPVHSTGPETYWTAEGIDKTTTTMDFSQDTITAYKLASIIYMTDELLDDAAFSLVPIITQMFASALAEDREAAIVAGSGVGQPTGIFTAAAVPTINCTAVGLTFDDIIDLIYQLPAKYRNNAAFIIHNNVVREIRTLKDGNNRYIWQDAVAPGQPATIYGYPVIESYDNPEAQIAFGDYKFAYWLGDRQRMTVKVTNDTETTFTQDKTAIRVVERFGGDVILPNAIRKIIGIP